MHVPLPFFVHYKGIHKVSAQRTAFVSRDPEVWKTRKVVIDTGTRKNRVGPVDSLPAKPMYHSKHGVGTGQYDEKQRTSYPSIANMVQTKYKICYVPRCRNVNIYSCTRYCPVTTTPCMLDLRLNNWPVGHMYHLQESENLIRQSKHKAVCTLRADRAAQLTVE